MAHIYKLELRAARMLVPLNYVSGMLDMKISRPKYRLQKRNRENYKL